MALTYTDGSTHNIDYGSGASLDNIGEGTMLLWVKPANDTLSLRQILTKGLTAGNRILIYRQAADAVLRLEVQRATSALIIRNTTTSLSGSWRFLAWTWSITGGTGAVYLGGLNTIAVDDTASVDPGSGAKGDDSANNWTLGGQSSNAYGGDYAFHAVWNRVLSLAKIRQQQFKPFPTPGCKLMAHNWNSSFVRDHSGNANNGTATVASNAAHPRLPNPFMYSGLNTGGAAAAGGGGKPWMYYAQL